ncbi:MAG: alkaline phosphatase family protein [Acidobacteriota bacterium]
MNNPIQLQSKASSTMAHSNHVVIVMEENRSFSSVVGQTSVWPNLNQLIREGALATHYYANVHPSIGNYFMLTAGRMVTTNDSSRTVWNVDNIARRMLSSGTSFRIYAEGISRGYLGGNTGLYVIRHNPFALLSDIADSRTVAYAHIFPFTQFATDLANGRLPRYSFVVPNIDDDAHSGSPQQADTWLHSKVIAPLSTDAAWQPVGRES